MGGAARDSNLLTALSLSPTGWFRHLLRLTASQARPLHDLVLRLDPGRQVAVVLNGSAFPVLIANKIGWIGQDEVDAVDLQAAHDGDAVSVKNDVDGN